MTARGAILWFIVPWASPPLITILYSYIHNQNLTTIIVPNKNITITMIKKQSIQTWLIGYNRQQWRINIRLTCLHCEPVTYLRNVTISKPSHHARTLALRELLTSNDYCSRIHTDTHTHTHIYVHM